MFEDRLKELRKEKGITQAQLAESIYVSRSLIAKFETGASYPNRETLEKLALYFNVPVSKLVDQDETTLMAVEAKSLSEKIHFATLIVVLAFAGLYSILVFVPLLQGTRYVYPIPPGQDYPNREFYFTSIFFGNYDHGNFIGLVSFLISLVVVCFSSLCLIFKKKPYVAVLRLLTYIFFVIGIFVCAASVICCLSYIS